MASFITYLVRPRGVPDLLTRHEQCFLRSQRIFIVLVDVQDTDLCPAAFGACNSIESMVYKPYDALSVVDVHICARFDWCEAIIIHTSWRRLLKYSLSRCEAEEMFD